MNSNLWDEKDGVFDVGAGCQIHGTIAEAVLRATVERRRIAFEFNGVTVTVAADSNTDLIYRDWSRALSGYIDKRVGPYPAAVLTEAERAHDATVEAANQRRRDESSRVYAEKAAAKLAATTAKLAAAPPMAIVDQAAWDSWKAANTDGYGGACMVYAEQWARLMQLAMASTGARLGDIADAASHDADTEGITGFMYGAAVSMLSKCWIHGEALRRWHNLKTQIGTEGERANESGGVLNPALLNIG